MPKNLLIDLTEEQYEAIPKPKRTFAREAILKALNMAPGQGPRNGGLEFVFLLHDGRQVRGRGMTAKQAYMDAGQTDPNNLRSYAEADRAPMEPWYVEPVRDSGPEPEPKMWYFRVDGRVMSARGARPVDAWIALGRSVATLPDDYTDDEPQEEVDGVEEDPLNV